MGESTASEQSKVSKEIVLRLGQLGVEVAASALQLGSAAAFINCAVDIWRTKTGQRQQQFAAALLEREPDLMARLAAAASGDRAGLRPDELELIGVGMASLSPTANAERVTRMAQLVSNGLGASEVETARTKRLARLLGQLDDEHLLVLMFFDLTATNERREQIATAHPHLFPVLSPKVSMIERIERFQAGFPSEPPAPKPTEAEVREKANQRLHFKLSAEHLQSLGLLRYEVTENGPDTRIYHLSSAGHEFLLAIGLAAMDRSDHKPYAYL
jgi:hypothetical protein